MVENKVEVLLRISKANLVRAEKRFNAREYLRKKGIISEDEEVYIITLGEKGEEFKEEEETSEEPYENYELLQQIDTEEYFSGEEV